MRPDPADTQGSSANLCSTDSLRSLRPGAPETFDWQGRTVILRAVRADDAVVLRALAGHVAAADLGPASALAIDATSFAAIAAHARRDGPAPAFIAIDIDEDGRCEALGVVQATVGVESGAAVLAIALRHDVKGRRLGLRLVAKTAETLHARGTRRVEAPVFAGNESMRALLRAVGFVMDPNRAEPGRAVYVAGPAKFNSESRMARAPVSGESMHDGEVAAAQVSR